MTVNAQSQSARQLVQQVHIIDNDEQTHNHPRTTIFLFTQFEVLLIIRLSIPPPSPPLAWLFNWMGFIPTIIITLMGGLIATGGPIDSAATAINMSINLSIHPSIFLVPSYPPSQY